jgi:hypothetical protein
MDTKGRKGAEKAQKTHGKSSQKRKNQENTLTVIKM